MNTDLRASISVLVCLCIGVCIQSCLVHCTPNGIEVSNVPESDALILEPVVLERNKTFSV